MKIKKINFFP